MSLRHITHDVCSLPCHWRSKLPPVFHYTWELVWRSALYIPCASQSYYVTMTGGINHAMNNHIGTVSEFLLFFFTVFYFPYFYTIVLLCG